MSETIVNYSVPPTHNVKRCLRCGSELDWLSDGTLHHVGRKAPQSDWAVCLERQLAKLNERADELAVLAAQNQNYFAAALEFIRDNGLTFNSETLGKYVARIRTRNAGL